MGPVYSITCTSCSTVNYVKESNGRVFKCKSCKDVSIMVSSTDSIIFENADKFGYTNPEQTIKQKQPQTPIYPVVTIVFSIIILLTTVLKYSFSQLSALTKK